MKAACAMALALFAGTGSAAAHQPEPLGVRPGWYLAPMYSFISFDANRESSSADGFALAMGYRWHWLALEVRGDYLESLSYTDRFSEPGQNPGDPPEERRVMGQAALSSGYVSLLIEPLHNVSYLDYLYASLGAGMVALDNKGAKRADDKTFPFEAGLGYQFPFKLFGFGLAARVEAIYRLDPDPREPSTEPNPQGRYADILYHAGIQIPLTPSEPAPAPELTSVAVVPTAVGDSDQDGVNDDRDQCPDTPSDSFVNNVGCPRPPVQGPVTLETARAGDTIVLRGVTFEFSSDRLTINAQAILDPVARTLIERPGLKLEIGGHTDGRGSDSYNHGLSERRADSVRRYLIEQGVSLERLSSVGYGESQPVDSNETDEGREHNRRVELKVLESRSPAASDEPRQETP